MLLTVTSDNTYMLILNIMKMQLPVRFTDDRVQNFAHTTLTFNSEKIAFLLIDSDHRLRSPL